MNQKKQKIYVTIIYNKNKVGDKMGKEKNIKKIVLVIFLFILLFSVSIFWMLNARAEYSLTKGTYSNYKGNGSSNHKSPDYGGNTFSLKDADGNSYAVFCTDPNRAIITEFEGGSGAYVNMSSLLATTLRYNAVVDAKGNCPAGYYYDDSGIKHNYCAPIGETAIESEQRQAISLFASYYQFANEDFDDATARAAVQVLIWEVATGSRSGTEDSPNYKLSNSWYAQYVADKETDFANAYRAAINYAKTYNNVPNKADEKYKMTWNDSLEAWEITINGDYSNFTIDAPSGIKVTKNDKKGITVTTKTYISQGNAKTINFIRDDDGASDGGEGKWYCKGPSETKCDHDYQKLVRGTTPQVKTNVKVWTEGVKVKVVKKNESNKNLSGSEFTFSNDSKKYTINGNGSEVVVVPGTYSIKETRVPTGYAKMGDLENIKIAPGSTENGSGTNCSWSYDSAQNLFTLVVKDVPYLINWFKMTEDGESLLKGNSETAAKFNVKDSKGKYVVVESSKSTESGYEGCYIYKSSTQSESSASIVLSDAEGEVCIIRTPSETYTVTEKDPGQYHTFGIEIKKDITADTKFKEKSSNNKFINIPTGFRFTKEVAKTDGGDGDQKIVVNGVEKTLTELTTEELKKLDFEIYLADANGEPTGSPLQFVLKNGIYEYVGNTIDGPGIAGATTILQLNDSRQINVDHLAWGTTYVIREVQSKVCDSSKTEEDCIGYYYPNYSAAGQKSTFTITTCSNPSANATSCPNGKNKYAIQKLINTPTEIEFTKKDFYNYNNQADIEDEDREKDEVDDSVEFETEKERSDFDRITFKLKDTTGKYLTLKFIGNHGNCKTDDSYSEYRYVPGDQSDAEGTELHTCGGHIHITNLCRGNDYKVEEIEVPDDSVYVKENTGSTPTEVNYKIPCTDGSYEKTSVTNVISDKPTRARFEKRDSKYNYLIPDETTTFKLYRCDKDTECHPGDYSTDEEREKNKMELVKFYKRGVINGDEEDPKDAEGNIGVEVYRRMSDSDAKDTDYVTELHPYNGILVMRYLQANYNYVLLETKAPKNYQMPIGRNAETAFRTTSETVDVDAVDVPNKPTSLLIKKYDSKGNLLPGAEFKIYEGTTCDANLSAMNQPKRELKLKTLRDGIYENRETRDSFTIKTCKDRDDEKCSDINPNGEITRLTYETNLGTWTDFSDESTKTKDGKKIEIQEGTALIQYLEYGHCYIIEETKAPEGHSLPAKAEDRFTMVTIDENDTYAHSTYYKFINKPTPFQFYKYDEFNKLIDGAEFKLQKLDDSKKYQDVTVSLDNDLSKLETIDEENAEALNKNIEELQKQAEEGVPFYKADSESKNTTITTKNGTAVVYYLSPGQYRILETKAPEGKELPKNPNIATFFVDENGNIYGNSVITNKSLTKKIEVKNSASAEFIINIQTGQTVIKYGLIISLLVAVITGLVIIKKKME